MQALLDQYFQWCNGWDPPPFHPDRCANKLRSRALWWRPTSVPSHGYSVTSLLKSVSAVTVAVLHESTRSLPRPSLSRSVRKYLNRSPFPSASRIALAIPVCWNLALKFVEKVSSPCESYPRVRVKVTRASRWPRLITCSSFCYYTTVFVSCTRT